MRFGVGMKGALRSLTLGLLAASIAMSAASAQQTLLEKSQNPIADLIEIPFQNEIDFDVGTLDNALDDLLIQPIVPMTLSPDWNLLIRPIVPITYKPPLFPGDSQEFGIGDIELEVAFALKEPAQIPGGIFMWGVGGTLLADTASDPQLGSGQWAAGPGGVVFFAIKPFTFGALITNKWSFAGNTDRGKVNLMTLQPFISYNMKGGWYLTSSPLMTADWEATKEDRFTIPLGGGFGRLFRIGHLPITAQVQAFGYPAKPEGGPDWTLRTQWTILLPTKKSPIRPASR